MRILIFSDSHRTTSLMDKIICGYERVDAIIHCGDIEEDCEYLRYAYPRIDLYTVSGNNDFFTQLPKNIVADFDGNKMYITHGHREGVKMGLDGICKKCAEHNCLYGIYGHTHRQACDFINGITLINPGSVRVGEYCEMNITDKVRAQNKKI